jgi:hypothetical protein
MNKIKIARWTYRICFVIGMLAALGLGFVPEVYGWFDPPAPVSDKGAVTNFFAGLGNAIRAMMIQYIVTICAALAVAASLIACAAAWVAREPWRIRFWCGLPMVVAAAAYGMLILVYG